MTEAQTKQPVVSVKPQSNIYTLLMIVAILAMTTTIVLVLYDLMSAGGYDMSFGDIFVALKNVDGLREASQPVR